jgi:hypothetical protein
MDGRCNRGGGPKGKRIRHGGAEAGWAWEKLAPKVKWELLVGSA